MGSTAETVMARMRSGSAEAVTMPVLVKVEIDAGRGQRAWKYSVGEAW